MAAEEEAILGFAAWRKTMMSEFSMDLADHE